MVIVLLAHEAVTPAGNPVGAPMPVAPVVECVTGVIGILMQTEGVDEGRLTVLLGVTVIVPVEFIIPQPPVRVTV